MTPSLLLDEICPLFGEQRSFALLDAARDENIYPSLLTADCNWASLYRGDAAARMAEVAPYLVELDRDSLFTRWLLRHGWGKSWGIFLGASAGLEILRSHFRKFLMAQLPDGRSVYFRFYDPRVLRAYLPTCTDEELKAIFGPVQHYAMENVDGELLLTFEQSDGILLKKRIGSAAVPPST
ncbi:MAG TPA: DUF4123 domain-containing protein [Thermoanaerobaculia bacterium]|jgi:hypothetical protein|nr:DUF4123 domain-containing protein [Thermoanaerobaculia bacterium]